MPPLSAAESSLVSQLTTRHARKRCQQRGISPQMLVLLIEYGREQHLGGGATVLSFPKQRRHRLRRALSRVDFAAVASHLDIYAVLNEHGTISTVGHRYQPMRTKH